MIKVILADDHQIIIDGMKSVLEKEKDIQVVGEASNGDEVLSFLNKHEVDVVVLDIEMPGSMGNGIEVTKIIRKSFANTKVLVLSMYKKKSFIINMLNVGAAGYILKNKSTEELIGAIHNVYNGIPHYSLEILNEATNINARPLQPEVKLSDRELDVLKLIAKARTTKEIAKQLFIAETTVNTHRRNLLHKIDVPNDKHLVLYAIKNEIVLLDDD